MSLFESSFFWLLFSVVAILIGIGFPSKVVNSKETQSASRLALLILLTAIVLGAFLRISHLDFGFPELYHPDEVRKARILKSMSEAASWNPKYFLHPSLLLYLAKIVSRLFYSLSIFPEEIILRNVLAGRFVSAMAGVGSIVLSYFIGKQLFRSALLGSVVAILVATSPLAIDCSRYFKEDSLFCFFLLSTFFVSLISTKKPRLLYLAGLSAGVCAGSKYTGIAGLFFPIFALFLPSLLSGMRVFTLANFSKSALIVLCAVTGFILTTPYAVLTPDALIQGFNSEKNHALTGHGGISISAWSRLFTYHISRSLYPGLTLPVLFVSLLGIGKLLKSRTTSSLFLLAGVVGFYLAAELVRSKPMPQPDRYALPAAIFFTHAAVFFIAGLSSTFIRSFVIAALVISSATFGIGSSLSIYPDTREKMSDWIVTKLPSTKKFILVGLPNYAPRLARFGYQMKAISAENRTSQTSIEMMKANYDFLLVTSLSYDRFFMEPEADQSLKQKFIEYDSNLELVHQEQSAFGSQGFHNPVLRLYRLR